MYSTPKAAQFLHGLGGRDPDLHQQYIYRSYIYSKNFPLYSLYIYISPTQTLSKVGGSVLPSGLFCASHCKYSKAKAVKRAVFLEQDVGPKKL